MSKRKEVVAGDRYGSLVTLREAPKRPGSRKRRCICRCDCGKEVDVRLCHLWSGHTRSCGCYANLDITRTGHAVHGANYHGMADSPEYGIWHGMKRRCRQVNAKDYAAYGGKGVRVCDRWLHSFKAFYEDMGARPSSDHSIDRIDGDGDYEPGNCRWATRSEQNRNRCDSVMLTHEGETMCSAAWAKRCGMSKGTLRDRLKAGWPLGKALTTRVRMWQRRKC